MKKSKENINIEIKNAKLIKKLTERVKELERKQLGIGPLITENIRVF